MEASDIQESLPFVPQKIPKWAKFVPGPSIGRLIPLAGKSMIFAILMLSGSFIIFFGYDASVMSQVNSNSEYMRLMGVDGGSSRDSAAEGGIVSVWFLGFAFGSLLVSALADKIGRLRTAFLGCLWAVLGAALQTSAQNITWMMFARVIGGIGCGHLNTVVPIWTSEISEPSMRGMFVATQFTLALVGSTVVYWMEYGLTLHSTVSISWRFPIAFQMVFLFINMICIPFWPESPRYLIHCGKIDEAKQVLLKCRLDNNLKAIEEEIDRIITDISLESENKIGWKQLLFPTNSANKHNTRRIALGVGVQVMQKLSGIDFIATYAPQMFQLSGYSSTKSTLLAGGNFFGYLASLALSIYTIDHVGRRKLMLFGSGSMSMLLFIGGGLSYKIRAADENTNLDALGAGVATILYLFTFSYGASWLAICFLYPSEIFSIQTRAKGTALAIIAFSITGGVINEIVPYLIEAVNYWIFFIFAIINLIQIFPVYFFYIETANRSLEELDLVFMSNSWLVSKTEKEFLTNQGRLRPEYFEEKEDFELLEEV